MIDNVTLGLAIAGFPLGVCTGYALSNMYPKPRPDEEALRKAMGQLVNLEEMEEAIRIRKYRMAKNGRTIQRFDGGPNAVMRKARVRSSVRRIK